jgi:alpha-tubulin suppressor-like RCC1 family protein
MISCGSSFTLALDNYGTVISWGEGSFGALGTGITDDCLKPTMVPFDK